MAQAPVCVRIVGSGLIGTSIGLALSRAGWDVSVDDASETTAFLARDLGAGRLPADDDEPDVVVVATPPDVTAQVVAGALSRWPRAVVTDVASVKGVIAEELTQSGADSPDTAGRTPWPGARSPVP